MLLLRVSKPTPVKSGTTQYFPISMPDVTDRSIKYMFIFEVEGRGDD